MEQAQIVSASASFHSSSKPSSLQSQKKRVIANEPSYKDHSSEKLHEKTPIHAN